MNLISPDTAITLAASLVTIFWTLFKSSELYNRIRQRRMRKALRILESAADATYRAYVREIKNASFDGKLSDEERHRARELAKEEARKIARRHGLNLARELGEDFLDLALSKIVNKLKSNA